MIELLKSILITLAAISATLASLANIPFPPQNPSNSEFSPKTAPVFGAIDTEASKLAQIASEQAAYKSLYGKYLPSPKINFGTDPVYSFIVNTYLTPKGEVGYLIHERKNEGSGKLIYERSLNIGPEIYRAYGWKLIGGAASTTMP